MLIPADCRDWYLTSNSQQFEKMSIESLRLTFTPNVNLYHVTEFPPLLSFTVYYFHSKISYASFIHKNCSGQLLSAYFLFWQILNLNLTFAVNVNLFFLEFLMLGMMYTQLAGDVTWQKSLLFSHLKLSYLGEHSKVTQARSLHACWTRMLYHDRLETIENCQSTNSAKTLKMFNVFSSLGL